ncbi:cyclin-dependent kinase 2-interacting protein [Biomphalaria pfeifferi]|uniref:Cyclin-dependent kinase 2-interacting protein n=1 Tax=Biomphalaria pfeifferi TaxID=112525 RepID=A0AAD8EVF2_BIOPF|nr:cyclin-dependent kinase 2-interacting protein [Biomphalaria pfeifferi]
MTSQDNSILSCVDSPVTQIRKHSAGNLTGDLRKVKDLAADIHNLILKWASLNSRGVDIITRIANMKIEKVFNVQEVSGGPQPAIPLELNPLCDLLLDLVGDMKKIVEKLESKTKLAESLVSLKVYNTSTTVSDVLFQTMSLEDIAKTVREICTDYQQEVSFKAELCKHVGHAANRDAIMFYTSCWAHQPYVSTRTCDSLQALLIETGHVQS